MSVSVVSFSSSDFVFLVCLFFMTNFHAAISQLEGELLDTQTTSRTLQKDLEREALLTDRLWTAISDLFASWELEPANEAGEMARGDALMDQLCYVSANMRDRV
jgi:hypothetical protein